MRAVLKSKIKAERQAQAANTIQWFVPLMGSDAIVNKEAFAQTVIPTLADGFTRKTIASWFMPTEQQVAAQEAMIELQKQQAKAIETENKLKSLDLSYVDPTSGGRFGNADIARALSSRGMPDEVLADYSAEPAPVGGRAKPTNTSRSLGYGIANVLPDNKYLGQAQTPGGYVPSALPAQPIPVTNEAAPETEDAASQATLSALMGPTTGGQYANNGISGVNSPLSQGVIS